MFLLAILSSCLYSPSSHESSCRNISLSCCFSDRQTAAPCNAGECCRFQTSAASFLTLKTRNLSHKYNARKKTQKQYEQLSCNKKKLNFLCKFNFKHIIWQQRIRFFQKKLEFLWGLCPLKSQKRERVPPCFVHTLLCLFCPHH